MPPNERSIKQLDGLSPDQMYELMSNSFSGSSPVLLKENIPNSTWQRIPFFHLMQLLLKIVEAQGEMKLTPQGRLKVKVLRELYDTRLLPDRAIESGITKRLLE
ncbi:MAG: hypothetical protein AAGI38_17200, partial [Bacteroidota bacterium]